MLKITAQRAAAMEMYGEGSFKVSGRCVIFTGKDGKTAIWGCGSKADAERQLASWRRVFGG